MESRSKLKKHGISIIIFLVIQYLLGMYTTMFVQFPEHAKEGQLWLFAWHQIPLALHIIIGLALLIDVIILIVRSFLEKSTVWIITSVVGAVAILTAVTGGSLFIPTQMDIYSFIMAVGFIIALLSFGWGVYKDK